METILPSSTMAKLSSTEVCWPVEGLKYLLYIFDVRVPNAFVAWPLKLRLTTHLPLVESSPPEAEGTCWPVTLATSRTYLYPPLHATIWLFVSSQATGLLW